MITAAEVSGDAHAGRLILALRKRCPEARFFGVGGEQMARAGCELLADTASRSSMMLSSLSQVLYFHKLIRRLARAMDERKPAVLVPVDSPAMNWHVAKAARKRGVGVMYYVCPQVWAWAPWRVRKIRRLTDAVACILPFEPDYLAARGAEGRFVGHPLFDELPAADPPDILAAAERGQFRIALLPGSRASEIARHAPALAAVRDRLARRYPQAEFTFTAVDDRAADAIARATGRNDLAIQVGDTPGVLKRSHFAVAASGTVTLEIAHFGVPMVVFYRVSRLGYGLLYWWIVRTKYGSLVNILAGRQLVPELMPWFGNVDELARQAEAVLADPAAMARTRAELLALVAPLKPAPPATAPPAVPTEPVTSQR